MDWKQRFSDICSDCRRWLRQAFSEWGEAIKNDTIQHGLLFVAGGVIVAGILAVL